MYHGSGWELRRAGTCWGGLGGVVLAGVLYAGTAAANDRTAGYSLNRTLIEGRCTTPEKGAAPDLFRTIHRCLPGLDLALVAGAEATGQSVEPVLAGAIKADDGDGLAFVLELLGDRIQGGHRRGVPDLRGD